MRSKLLLSCVFTGLVLLAILQGVSAQTCVPGAIVCNPGPGEYVKISGVNAPPSVGTGQPITVSITVSYEFTQALSSEFLIVAIRPHTETGNPYPTLGSTNCYPASESPFPSSESICIADTTAPFFTPSVVTVSFTLTAPSTPQTWRPTVLAIIAVTNAGSYLATQETAYRVITITVT